MLVQMVKKQQCLTHPLLYVTPRRCCMLEDYLFARIILSLYAKQSVYKNVKNYNTNCRISEWKRLNTAPNAGPSRSPSIPCLYQHAPSLPSHFNLVQPRRSTTNSGHGGDDYYFGGSMASKIMPAPRGGGSEAGVGLPEPVSWAGKEGGCATPNGTRARSSLCATHFPSMAYCTWPIFTLDGDCAIGARGCWRVVGRSVFYS